MNVDCNRAAMNIKFILEISRLVKRAPVKDFFRYETAGGFTKFPFVESLVKFSEIIIECNTAGPHVILI